MQIFNQPLEKIQPRKKDTVNKTDWGYSKYKKTGKFVISNSYLYKFIVIPAHLMYNSFIEPTYFRQYKMSN